MPVTLFIVLFIGNAILYSVGYSMGIRHHKTIIQKKQSIGVLVIEEDAGEPVNLYLAIDSFNKLYDCGSEVILQVKRK